MTRCFALSVLGCVLGPIACGSPQASDRAESSVVHRASPPTVVATNQQNGNEAAQSAQSALAENAVAASDTSASDSAPSAEVPQSSGEPDGNDEEATTHQGHAPRTGRFERVGKAPSSLRQICDFAVLGDALYSAHSLSALSADGATVSRYNKHDKKRPFTIAFDWNRPGQPSKGGGAGQGFLRIRNIDGRLYVPDADPPYNGFGLVDRGTEGYVFVSDSNGKFAPSYAPNYRPPGRPSTSDKAGASVVPRAYHVFDVIRFRGKLITSTGAVPPKERAWVGPSPGALHVASDDLTRFDYQVSYPNPYTGGVYRLTFLTRFLNRLYAGIEDYDGRAQHDLVMVRPEAGSQEIRQEDLSALRITEGGAAQTLRFYAHQGSLYWIAWAHDGVRLRRTTDGEHFEPIALPHDSGAPLDIVRFRDGLFVLAEWGLYRLEQKPEAKLARRDQAINPLPMRSTQEVVAAEETRFNQVVRITDKKTPFQLRDALCAAPLVVYDDELYAGGQTDGSLYRLIEE